MVEGVKEIWNGFGIKGYKEEGEKGWVGDVMVG